ncbi:MAG: DUF418 domain-containing protein [Caulobacterales bacterium]|nr:DUF418 domain-containing protein [Caulobacterales bacterium]
MTTSTERFQSIDAVRGFAVLGILLMNIVGMGLPTFAYVDPTYLGPLDGANFWVWAVNFVITDGKMRALFTMLFGASMLLIADRAEGRTPGPAATHYRRVWWLFVIGMIHAYFLFFGDILVCYAIAGAIAFFFRKLPAKALIAVGALILIALLTKSLVEAEHIKALQAAVAAGVATPAQAAQWQDLQLFLNAPDSMGQEEIAWMQGDFFSALKSRARAAMIVQLGYLPLDAIPEAVGQMLVGAGLFRMGFFTLGWSSRAYAAMIAVGYLIGAPIMVWLCWSTVQADFEPVQQHWFFALTAGPRPFIALAHASVLMLVIRAGAVKGLINRLEAAGRMAFSNYLMTSIITTFVFCGFGLGLYGQLERYELYYVVLGVWAFILLWSKPWLARFHYGPFEWLWRSLVMWKPQPFVQRAAAA